MLRWLSGVVLVCVAMTAGHDAQAQPYCARNNQIGLQEPCFDSQAEAEEYLREDILPNQRRRFLEPSGDPVFSFSGNPAKWNSVFIPHATGRMEKEAHIVTWFSAHRGEGPITIYEPYPDGPVTELPPPDEYYGRKSEGELIADILDRDNAPGPGELIGQHLEPPACGGIARTDPLALGRLQMHCNHDAAPDFTVDFDSGAHGWSVRKYSRWWCSRGLDSAIGGKCTNDEQGYLRLGDLPHQTCPVTGMPCVPATGAKELHERDFTWGRWTFTRHYSSIEGLPFEAIVGENWSHDFQTRILPLRPGDPATRRMMVDERRNFDVFTDVDATWMRSQNVTGRRLMRTGNPSMPFKLFHKDREEWFNAQGNLAHIELPGAPADSLDLTYCDSSNFDSGACTGAGLLWRATDRRGRSIEFVYSAGQYSGVVSTSEYIPRRLIGIRTQSEWLVQYGHDTPGRLTVVTYPGGSEREYHYQEATHLCRDSLGQAESPCPAAAMTNYLTGITDELGTRLSDYTYDRRGRVTSSEWANGAYPEKLKYPSATTRELIHPEGRTEVLTYSTYLSFKKPASSQDPSGTTTYGYDASGRRTSAVDKRGVETRYEYAGERVSAVIEAFGTPQQRRVESDWNLAADVVTERRTKNAAGNVVARETFAFNARRQVTSHTQIDPLNAATRTTAYTYCEALDVALIGSTCPVLGLLSTVDGPRTDLDDITTYEYYPADDVFGCAGAGPCHRKGDLWKVTNALGHVTEMLRYDLHGRPLSTKDANGVVTELAYHPRGWLASRTVKGSAPVNDAATHYAYDAAGQITRITAPDEDWTDFEYDDAHRLIAIEDALGNRIEYTVNDAGERTAETTKDPNAAITRSLSREYDALGRLDVSRNAYAHATDFAYDAMATRRRVKIPSASKPSRSTTRSAA